MLQVKNIFRYLRKMPNFVENKEMARHNELGMEGESVAVEYLKKKGYMILHTNWHSGQYELDIVARTRDELVIIEVKTRSPGSPAVPESAVDKRKIRNIVAAADRYIRKFDVGLPARFDIITLIGNAPNFETDHIEGAFLAPVNVRW